MEVEASKIVDEWRVEEQAIESIEYAAMSGQNVGRILCARATFESAFGEVAEDADDSHYCRERQGEFKRQFAEEPEVRECRHCEGCDDPTDCAFPRFTGTDRRREFTFS